MAEIIHDPTRGWLLLTEKWPVADSNCPCEDCDREFLSAVDDCISTAIQIDPNDWTTLHYKLPSTAFVMLGPNLHPKSNEPLSVDAEFEVVTQQLRYDNWKPKEIARLVKAKEKWQPKDPGPAGHFNPTDSVTSDGITPTKSPRGQCNCTPEEQHGETSVMCCNRCGKPTEDFWSKPTESQDELWDEVYQRLTGDNNGSFLSREDQLSVIKSRFRIERI